MKKLIYLVAAAALFFTSCKEDQDEENPQIDQLTLNGEVISVNAEANAGETLTMVIACSDNESLNQLKIDLHPNEDGHSHGEVGSGEGSSGDWEVLEIIDLEGTSQTVTRSYVVPEDARGEWHLGLSLIDESGNEATPKFIDLDIENDFIPSITIVDLGGVEPDELQLVAGTTLTINGSVTDSSGLTSISLLLTEEDGTELYSNTYDGAGNTTFDLNTASFEIPVAAGSTVDFSISATDSDGYVYEWEVELSYQ